jgi:uncharacterized RDD family membrane protein YckC
MEEENKNKDLNQNNNDNPGNQDFSAELETEKKNLDAEKFAQRQEQYKQILQTPESINFETQNPYIWRIGFGRRLGAYIIDNVFVCLLIVIIAAMTGVAERMMDFVGSDFSIFVNPEKMEELNLFIIKNFTPLTLAITFIYYSLEIIFAQSLGKMLLGMQIGNANEKFASYPKLLLRFVCKLSSNIFTLLYLITSLTIFSETFSTICSFLFFVGCFFVLGARKQGFHDMIAGTAIYFKDELQQLNSNKEGKY